jgi:amidase
MLSSVKLNRDYADSLDGVVRRLKTPRIAAEATALGQPVRWTLDRVRGMASPQGATGALKSFEVPVKPMLGRPAVAPGFGYPPFSTGDTEDFGGNMDFNAIVEGNTAHLPVPQPGALLYLGDGHALQGNGEIMQWALETSLDVVVRVELLKQHSIATPRVESPAQIMTLGQGGSSDDVAHRDLRHVAVAAPGLRVESLRGDPGAWRSGTLSMPPILPVVASPWRRSWTRRC